MWHWEPFEDFLRKMTPTSDRKMHCHLHKNNIMNQSKHLEVNKLSKALSKSSFIVAFHRPFTNLPVMMPGTWCRSLIKTNHVPSNYLKARVQSVYKRSKMHLIPQKCLHYDRARSIGWSSRAMHGPPLGKKNTPISLLAIVFLLIQNTVSFIQARDGDRQGITTPAEQHKRECSGTLP